MREAMETIQEEIVVNNVTFQRKKLELQRYAKQQEVVASNQGARETSQGHCVIRYYNYYSIFQSILISS